MTRRISYLKKRFDAYILKKDSQLSLWHGCPSINYKSLGHINTLSEYYMPFLQKANYQALIDDNLIPNFASPFYHKLHIIQLEIMYKLTQIDVFKEIADKWEIYSHFSYKKTKAFLFKSFLKLKYFQETL